MPTFGKLEDGTPWVAIGNDEEEDFKAHMPCSECGEEICFSIRHFTDDHESLPPIQCEKCGHVVEVKRKRIDDPLAKLSKDELLDLLNAYDAYVKAGCNPALAITGWTPVCVREFFECEYRNVWLAGGDFSYLEEVESD